MFKKYRILKWTGIFLVVVIIVIVAFGIWFKNLIPTRDVQIEFTSVENLPYLSEEVVPKRGKIVAVVTSTGLMGNSEKITGYELSELARAYYTFMANGFEVDVASPQGGKPPVVIDDEDLGVYDFAFLNDPEAQFKTSHTLKIDDIVSKDYDAIFFVGGKGAMFDFPDNKILQSIIKNYHESNKIIGAVCHGPAALVNVTLDDGSYLIEDKNVSGFTNQEELLLISDAASIFPFLLEDKITSHGGNFKEGSMYLEQVSHDENLITGQNPWSTWKVAERIIVQLGHTPKHRPVTDEENAVEILSIFQSEGKQKAKEMIETMIVKEKKPVNRALIAKHSIVAAMKGEVGQFFSILKLVSFAKKCESKSTEI